MSEETTAYNIERDPIIAAFLRNPDTRRWMRALKAAPDLTEILRGIGDDVGSVCALLLTLLPACTRRKIKRTRKAVLWTCAEIVAHHDGDNGENLAYFADKSAFDSEEDRLDQIKEFIETSVDVDQEARGGYIEVERDIEAILACEECREHRRRLPQRRRAYAAQQSYQPSLTNSDRRTKADIENLKNHIYQVVAQSEPSPGLHRAPHP